MATLGLENRLDSSWHGLDELQTLLRGDGFPHRLQALPQLVLVSWLGFVLVQLALDMEPQVLNRIEVWRLRWPLQDLDFVVLEPFLGGSGRVLGVIVVLEHNVPHFHAVILQGRKELVIQNTPVQLGVKAIVDFAHVAHALRRHAAPNHQRPTAMLDSRRDMVVPERFPVGAPAVLLPVGPLEVDFSLVRPDNAHPVLHGPVLVLAGKGQSRLAMLLAQQRLLALGSDLQPCAAKNPPYGACGHGGPRSLGQEFLDPSSRGAFPRRIQTEDVALVVLVQETRTTSERKGL